MQRFADRYLGKYLRRGYKGGKKSSFPSSQDTSSHATNRTYRVTTTFPTWLNTPAGPEQYCQLDRFPISFDPSRVVAHNFSMLIRARKPRAGQWLKYIQLIMYGAFLLVDSTLWIKALTFVSIHGLFASFYGKQTLILDSILLVTLLALLFGWFSLRYVLFHYTLRSDLYLLHDARSRLDTSRGLRIVAALREAHCNLYGPSLFAYPAWLKKTWRQFARLHKGEQFQDMVLAYVAFLREILTRAQTDASVCPEILAVLHVIYARTLYQSYQQALHQRSHPQVQDTQVLEDAVVSYKVALQVYTPDRYPALYAQTLYELGTVYADSAMGVQRENLTVEEQHENVEQTITCYHEALCYWLPKLFPPQYYALTLYHLGCAYLNRIVGEQSESVEQAMACYHQALHIWTSKAYPYEYGATQCGLGYAYIKYVLPRPQENREQAIVCYSEALRTWTLKAFPQGYAFVQYNLAALYALHTKGGRQGNLERAIACSYEALRVWTLEAAPDGYALIQSGLGNIYARYRVGEQRANVELAISYYLEALQRWTHDLFPHEYATIQYNLGVAYANRLAGERSENVEQAIICYCEATRVHTLDTSPSSYAAIMYSLGSAYMTRVEGKRRANLEQAIECYFQALCVYTLDAFPHSYANVQSDLGRVYAARIEGERRENLERAINCFSEALHVYTPETFSYNYANTKQSLGDTYRGRIEGDQRANHARAIECYREALCVWTLDSFPYEYATVQMSLGNTYKHYLEGERRTNLEQAIECYHQALNVLTIVTHPSQYAATQFNLSGAYAARIEGERHENQERCLESLFNALQVWTSDAHPSYYYALVQERLGDTYHDRLTGEQQENLEQAVVHFREALRVLTLEAFPTEHRRVQLSIARVEAQHRNWVVVHEAYSHAREAEDLLVAMSAGVVGRDTILKQGRDAAVRDGFALVCLGRAEAAAVVIEQGRTRGFAEAIALDTAAPERIGNPQRRDRYTATLRHFVDAQVVLHEALPSDEEERRRINLQRIETYREAKAAFDTIVAEIHAAEDPGDFLNAPLDATTILHTAEYCGSGHAIVYLAATPWGGMAVAAFSATAHATARFGTLDLPNLTQSLVDWLVEIRLNLNDGSSRAIGGFGVAQRGDAFDLLQQCLGTTLREQAQTLHAICEVQNLTLALDEAAQEMLADPEFAQLVDLPVDTLDKDDVDSILNHRCHMLNREIKRCQEQLAQAAMQPLIEWLCAEGVTGLTLIPCGPLAAFPIVGIQLVDGRTVGETLPTSVVPSIRALLRDDIDTSQKQRAGICTLGDPFHRSPHKQKPLYWSCAEALTLSSLGRQLGLAATAHVQWGATREVLLDALQTKYVIDACCHGQFNADDVLRSCLALAYDETLTLADMLNRQHDLRGLRLLILSACQTAILDVKGAYDEVHSLAAGMLQAGACAVLGSLWAVEDEPTYLLMVRFAQEWFPVMEQEAPAAALARAQHWLRTVTKRDLQAWSNDLLSAERTPELLPESTERLVAIRGRDYRYDKGQAQMKVRNEARESNDPDTQPYADPYYWSGFQVNGW